MRFAVAFVIVALSLAHWPFVLHGYGEQDAALTGIVATLWAQDGKLPVESGVFVERRFRSNPLYTYGIYRALAGKVIDRTAVPWCMSLVSAVCGMAVVAAVFLLLVRLASVAEAAVGTVLLSTAPIFFHSKCYGFPTLPALTLFMLALLAFQEGMVRRRSGWLWSAGACGLVVAAVLTKVDVVLAGLCLPVIALTGSTPADRRRYFVLACILPVIGVITWYGFCHWMIPQAAETAQSFERWSQSWPFTPAGLIDPDNVRSIVMGPGVGTGIAFVAAVGIGLSRKGFRPATLGAVMCIGPTLLFWGMREAVSSRHNLWIVVPIAAFVGFVMHRSIGQAWVKVLMVAAICGGNYFVGPGTYNPKTASACLLTSAGQRKDHVRRRDRAYEVALREPIRNRMLCFYMNYEPAYSAAMAVGLGRQCRLRRTGPADSVWNLFGFIEGVPKTIWIPARGDRSAETRRRIFQGGWIAITERQGDPPFFRLLPNGTYVPWPMRLETSGAPGKAGGVGQ